jgi:hypothetical protein
MPTVSRRLALAACLSVFSFAAAAAELPTAPPGAEVYFISPMNGDHVAGKFVVRFGLRGMGVAPAGVDLPDTGHHHLLINADPLPDLTQALPASAQVLHFGKGQTETELELPPGTYTLQLVLGNALHIPFSPPVMSGTIKITVNPE